MKSFENLELTRPFKLEYSELMIFLILKVQPVSFKIIVSNDLNELALLTSQWWSLAELTASSCYANHSYSCTILTKCISGFTRLFVVKTSTRSQARVRIMLSRFKIHVYPWRNLHAHHFKS